MTCCSHCRDAGDLFSERTARRDLKRYRKKGPNRTTRLLVEALRPQMVEGSSLLDVGGGVGAIQHELIGGGVARAVQVDASIPYLEAAREEAERRGHADRVAHVYGDVVDLADELADAEIVTLDRVICCYPAMERLVDASAPKALRLYGVVYPRERWATRVALAFGNVYMWLRRSAFRTFLHPPAAVDERIRQHGFRRATHERTFLWEVATYTRSG